MNHALISPAQARELAAIADPYGVRLLDAPISGGAEGAMAGTLAVMIGGDASAVDENRKALEAIGSKLHRFGDVGAGESVKAINQILVCINNAAVAEAVLLAARSGLDLKAVHDLISNSAGNSWIFQEITQSYLHRVSPYDMRYIPKDQYDAVLFIDTVSEPEYVY